MSVSTLQNCSVNLKMARLRWRKYQYQFLQAVVCVCELKTALQAGNPKSEVRTIIPTAMFFTKNEIMPGNSVKAVSERTVWCCYSSHSSADEIIDFISSLQSGSITPFVCPDKDTPLDPVKAFILNTLKHQNPNTSNYSSTKLWKEKNKFNKRVNCNHYLEKISTNTPD